MKGLADHYRYEQDLEIFVREGFNGIAYSDGDEVELRIASVVGNASDLSVLSCELREHCTDWPSLYHLSSVRANLLRPFESLLMGDVLEIGAGCGAITRYLGECGGQLLALEGSPRRAAIARARTRELENVTVVCDEFGQFECGKLFDFVTLIGVLEYANLFMSDDNPALGMLVRARSFLKPNGRLIIAIENQLGLKYFAGAPEDHVGVPMYGIEGRYSNDQPQTFGRKELEDLMKRAGFISTEFFVPFPDYKLPVSIVTERGFSSDSFDAAALAWQSVRRDPQMPSIVAFSPELVWPSIVNNGLAIDLANSFLVTASTDERDKGVSSSFLAWHFSTDRLKKFCKINEFIEGDEKEVVVRYRRVCSADIEPVVGCRLHHDLSSQAEYRSGRLLSCDLMRIVMRDGWSIGEVCVFLREWLVLVAKLAAEQGQLIDLSSRSCCLPNGLFDCMPQNIIVSADGSVHVIDDEWTLNEPLDVGYLVFRSIWNLIHTISRYGHSVGCANVTYWSFISSIFNGFSWFISDDEIVRYLTLELEIQKEVSGAIVDLQASIDWMKNTTLPTNNLNQAVSERDKQVAILNQAVSERDKQVAILNQAVSERDGQVAILNQAVSERDGHIDSLGIIVAERDGQVAGLTQAVSERDKQIAILIQAVSERGGQIAIINQAVSERDKQIAILIQAVSERGGQIAILNQAVSERDEQIVRLNQSLSEREGRILSLAQTIAEQDGQIVGLKQTVVGGDSLILGLNLTVEERGQMLAKVYGSRSWRLTAPLRSLMRLFTRFRLRLSRKSEGVVQEVGVSLCTPVDTETVVMLDNTNDKNAHKYRILLVSHYCPTYAHAGGLRILDIYTIIKQRCPNVQLDLLTHHRPSVDGSIADLPLIFDNIYLSPQEELSLSVLSDLAAKKELRYEVVDLQFHQSAYNLDEFKCVGSKILFTPMESLSKDLFEMWNRWPRPSVDLKTLVAHVRGAYEEITFCSKADEVICVSESDANFIREGCSHGRVAAIETCVSPHQFADALAEFTQIPSCDRPRTVIYVAYWGSDTNLKALRWYLQCVHPRIVDAVSGYKLMVVGRGDLSLFQSYCGSQVDLVGEVSGLAPYIKSAKLGIAPALSGAGFRGKINQYAVHGIPTVASSVAMQGLLYRDGVSIYVADKPGDFAERCISLLTDDDLNDHMAHEARELCLSNYLWTSKWPKICGAYGLCGREVC